jgi:Protein of unknown function (DUF2892)
MRNIGEIDKVIRVVIGVGVLAVGYYYNNPWGWVGLIPLGTAMAGWCPVYAIFGAQTSPIDRIKV